MEPFPPYLISAGMFLCERILTETDGVVSAIRLVDVFNVPEGLPPLPEGAHHVVQAFLCIILKTAPKHTGEHLIELKLLDPKGKSRTLGQPFNAKIETKPDLEDVPTGATINVQLNIGAADLGTSYVCCVIDGQEIARTPFTLRPRKTVETVE